MTRRQKEVLDFISDHINEHGYSPSYKVIGLVLGIKPPSVHTHIQALKSQGLIMMKPYSRFAIKVVEQKITCPKCKHEFEVM